MSEELRMWLMVYFELLFQSPAVVDDEVSIVMRF